MTAPTMYDYNGYKITTRFLKGEPVVAVFDPRDKRGPALHKTTSIDKAARWIDGFRAGEQWAIDAREKA